MKKIEKIQKQIKAIEKPTNEFTNALVSELDTNPDFSLDVDPTNKYNMSDLQKDFVKNYIDFKSIPIAAEMTNIDIDTAKAFYVAYSSQQEIRRINRALYQRQFSSKLLSIDQIGSYLSSLITDENVPVADRLKTMDKVRVAGMLLDLNKYKLEAIQNPANIIDVDIETEIKSLSVKSIKTLLSQKHKKKDNSTIVQDGLLPEEEAYLKTLPTKALLELVDEGTKK